ncbi:PREDICTED: nascent polypeptide-associated complex subunit alpha, muscle-specific form-like [Priapulus caudatus]|uniref:Nascent polypeptide-associated complex subunit alpha, muscle-specific form-like n=1 Tax=Priapulus caudatus TaxID=37621 RepID=A0ABM1DQG2_PRICU|nr:PREDICTED: nascent polypeptide-associated complex subunit alpha, muscle-specific form-like [Priapulus caudatus]
MFAVGGGAGGGEPRSPGRSPARAKSLEEELLRESDYAVAAATVAPPTSAELHVAKIASSLDSLIESEAAKAEHRRRLSTLEEIIDSVAEGAGGHGRSEAFAGPARAPSRGKPDNKYAFPAEQLDFADILAQHGGAASTSYVDAVLAGDGLELTAVTAAAAPQLTAASQLNAAAAMAAAGQFAKPASLERVKQRRPSDRDGTPLEALDLSTQKHEALLHLGGVGGLGGLGGSVRGEAMGMPNLPFRRSLSVDSAVMMKPGFFAEQQKQQQQQQQQQGRKRGPKPGEKRKERDDTKKAAKRKKGLDGGGGSQQRSPARSLTPSSSIGSLTPPAGFGEPTMTPPSKPATPSQTPPLPPHTPPWQTSTQTPPRPAPTPPRPFQTPPRLSQAQTPPRSIHTPPHAPSPTSQRTAATAQTPPRASQTPPCMPPSVTPPLAAPKQPPAEKVLSPQKIIVVSSASKNAAPIVAPRAGVAVLAHTSGVKVGTSLLKSQSVAVATAQLMSGGGSTKLSSAKVPCYAPKPAQQPVKYKQVISGLSASGIKVPVYRPPQPKQLTSPSLPKPQTSPNIPRPRTSPSLPKTLISPNLPKPASKTPTVALTSLAKFSTTKVTSSLKSKSGSKFHSTPSPKFHSTPSPKFHSTPSPKYHSSPSPKFHSSSPKTHLPSAKSSFPHQKSRASSPNTHVSSPKTLMTSAKLHSTNPKTGRPVDPSKATFKHGSSKSAVSSKFAKSGGAPTTVTVSKEGTSKLITKQAQVKLKPLSMLSAASSDKLTVATTPSTADSASSVAASAVTSAPVTSPSGKPLFRAGRKASLMSLIDKLHSSASSVNVMVGSPKSGRKDDRSKTSSGKVARVERGQTDRKGGEKTSIKLTVTKTMTSDWTTKLTSTASTKSSKPQRPSQPSLRQPVPPSSEKPVSVSAKTTADTFSKTVDPAAAVTQAAAPVSHAQTTTSAASPSSVIEVAATEDLAGKEGEASSINTVLEMHDLCSPEEDKEAAASAHDSKGANFELIAIPEPIEDAEVLPPAVAPREEVPPPCEAGQAEATVPEEVSVPDTHVDMAKAEPAVIVQPSAEEPKDSTLAQPPPLTERPPPTERAPPPPPPKIGKRDSPIAPGNNGIKAPPASTPPPPQPAVEKAEPVLRRSSSAASSPCAEELSSPEDSLIIDYPATPKSAKTRASPALKQATPATSPAGARSPGRAPAQQSPATGKSPGPAAKSPSTPYENSNPSSIKSETSCVIDDDLMDEALMGLG